MSVLNHSMTVERMKVVFTLSLPILVVEVVVMCGVERHRVDVKGTSAVEKRSERQTVSALFAVIRRCEPIGVEEIFRRSKDSSFLFKLGFFGKIHLALNIIGRFIILSPQTIEGHIHDVFFKGLIPESPRSLNVEPIDVDTLVQALQTDKVAIIL